MTLDFHTVIGHLFLCACLALVVLAILILIRKLTFPKPKAVSFVVHVQGRTESDEHMDFAVNLLEEETVDEWKAKLRKAFDLREWRLKEQNDRMLALMAEQAKGPQPGAPTKE